MFFTEPISMMDSKFVASYMKLLFHRGNKLNICILYLEMQEKTIFVAGDMKLLLQKRKLTTLCCFQQKIRILKIIMFFRGNI